MPNHSCLNLALQAKEIKCPECDYVMEIWAWKESLIYHCHECGQMAFQLCSRGDDLRQLLKDADLKEKGNTCPFCDMDIVEGKKKGHMIRGCPDCGWVLTINQEKKSPQDIEQNELSRQPSSFLKQETIGLLYEETMKDLVG